MKLKTICWLVLITVLYCATAGKSVLAVDRHVVLISVDGLSATYLEDPRAPIPTIRKLVKRGAVAEGMVTTFPSVTWPSHVSLITGASPGKHGVIANSTIDRKTMKEIKYIGDPVFTKDECVRIPTLYDVVSQNGMKTGAIIWPACNGATTLNWVIPDSNQEAIHRKYTTPGLVAELDRAGISIGRLGRWGWKKENSAMRDSTYARVGCYLLKQYQPHLLLMHLITPDHFEHAYGPHVEEAYWAVNNADDRIREIWETLEQPPLKGKSTLFIVSDHGFAEYDKLINPNVLLRKEGFIKVGKNGNVTNWRVRSHSSGGSDLIYILDEKHKESIRTKLKSLLSKLEGVAQVLDVDDFKRYGLPDPSQNPEQADLMLSAKPGYSFANSYKGTNPITDVGERRGSHGHLPDPHYMHASFIAAGAGIKSGIKLKTISNLDVAPTIAKLLGVELPTSEGRVLTEILDLGETNE